MLGDDEEIEVVSIEPMLHNRWAIIAPGLDLVSNIAGEIQQTFKIWAVFAAQHGCQLNYDRKFREVIDGHSRERSGTDVPED
jgi:hypothetical protein